MGVIFDEGPKTFSERCLTHDVEKPQKDPARPSRN